MNVELWKTIQDFPDYEASTEGRIRTKGGHILSTSRNNCDYEIVVLYRDHKPYCRPVHRLVAQTFISNPDKLTDVDHINNDKTNNSISNLNWLSHRDNCRKYFDEKKYKEHIILSVVQGHYINIYIGKRTLFQGTYISPSGTQTDYFTLSSDPVIEIMKLTKMFQDYMFSIHSEGEELYIQGMKRL